MKTWSRMSYIERLGVALLVLNSHHLIMDLRLLALCQFKHFNTLFGFRFPTLNIRSLHWFQT